MIEGLLLTLYWWALIVMIGAAALPLTRRFFQSFPDKGYILSKGLGLTLVCFINWMLCSVHLLSFSLASTIVSILLLLTASFFLREESWTQLVDFFKSEKKFIIRTELIFLASFLFFALIRMCNPDIASTEKMPDFAFLTGILNSHYFPPKDPWFLGETINYFYYGHYQISFLTKLSGVAPEYAYNLGIVFLFAITLTMAMGVSYGLIKQFKYGFLGGIFVALIGNLDGIIQFSGQLGKVVFNNDKLYPFDWFNWWMSSRVIVREGIDITINEFPFWSYILGDLHAHVNVVPFSLLVLGIVLEIFQSGKDGFQVLGDKKQFIFRLMIAAIALGVIPAANTWDTPTYFGLICVSLIYTRQLFLANSTFTFGSALFFPFKEIYLRIIKKTASLEKYQNASSIKKMGATALIVVLIVGSAVILYSPFHLHFKPSGAQGVKIVDAAQRTLADDFITIYGFFFLCILTYLGVFFSNKVMKIPKHLQMLVIAAASLAFIMVFAIAGTFMVALCITALIILLVSPIEGEKEEQKSHFFALLLVFVVLAILLGCEFFYIKDAYGKSLERQNTIFKFYYQAWIFCGISSAYAVYYIREKINKSWIYAWESAYRFLLICTFAFPVFGATVKCAHFSAFKNSSPYSKATMEGTWYMSWRFKGDYQAIQYLKKNASPDENVLEATGPAFSHYGRISAATGMSTILGWANHENIWRDGTWQKVTQRSNEIKEIYTTTNNNRAIELLKNYKIKYVFVGGLEREQYPDGKFDKFGQFMTKVSEVMDSDQQMSYLFRLDN